MRRRVLVLQNTPDEDAGRLPVALTEAALEWSVVRTWVEPVPAGPRHDSLVVLGGPVGVYEADRYPFLREEMTTIRSYAAAGRPVLGICLGAQLAAEALGGKVRPGPTFEAGWNPVELTPQGREDPVIGALASAPAVFHWHGDTFDLPPGAVRLASTAAYREQAFRLGSVLGLQFHVEVTPEAGAAWSRAQASFLRARGLDPGTVATAPRGAAAGLERALERVAAFLDGR